jgi:hypothetical protein
MAMTSGSQQRRLQSKGKPIHVHHHGQIPPGAAVVHERGITRTQLPALVLKVIVKRKKGFVEHLARVFATNEAGSAFLKEFAQAPTQLAFLHSVPRTRRGFALSRRR